MTTAMVSLDQALRFAEEAERDPVAAVKRAGAIRQSLARAKEELTSTRSTASGDLSRAIARMERALEETRHYPLAALGVTHIVRVDDAPAVNPAQTTGALKIEWPGGQGIARSMFAGTLDGDPASLSRMSVRIAVNGSDDLFTTGEAPAFVPLVAFQAQNHNWFRLKDYAVSPAQKWTVYFQNEGPAAGNPITPFLLFGFVKGH